MLNTQLIVLCCQAAFPTLQVVYLFGSYASGDPWPNSDVDIALLLPPKVARQAGSLYLTSLHDQLEKALHREADLINLRRVSTVFQH